MEILHETVQTIPRLPFKFYEHDPLTPIAVQPHWHQGIELNYLQAGGPLKFVTDGHTTEYRPGDLWTVDRRVVHSASGPEHLDWNEFGLIIDDDWLLDRLPASANWQLTLNGAVSNEAHPNAYRMIREHLVAIRERLTHPTTDLLRLEILSHFYGLLATLGAVFVTPLAASAVNPNQSLVDSVMTAINRRYAEPITGNTLASEFNVSLTTLNQQFKKNVQLSVNRYLRLIRLMNARRLLLESDLNIEYVASACGFPNGKTLNRNFKSWKGMTPTDYRQAYARYHRIDTSCF